MMGRDQLYVHLAQFDIEPIVVIGTVADESFRKLFYESRSERLKDELRFMSLTTRNPDGDRKTMAVCHCHDLGRFAASSFPNQKTPFFAPAWLPSMNASLRSTLPRSCRSRASAARMRSSTPSRSHF
jgi:hypothetical protein